MSVPAKGPATLLEFVFRRQRIGQGSTKRILKGVPFCFIVGEASAKCSHNAHVLPAT
jgi:hypothetical protein